MQYKKCWWEDYVTNGGGIVCDLPIRYTMFPATKSGASRASSDTNGDMNGAGMVLNGANGTNGNEKPPDKRGVIMAVYVFGQDASLLGSMEPADRVANYNNTAPAPQDRFNIITFSTLLPTATSMPCNPAMPFNNMPTVIHYSILVFLSTLKP